MIAYLPYKRIQLTMMKNKIVFLIRDLNYGGAQRQLVTLVKGMDKKLFDISVVCMYSGGSLEKDLTDSNISLICLNKQGRWYIASFIWQLIKTIKNINPNVLHGYLGDANLLCIFLKLFLPSTTIIWGIRDSITDKQTLDWLQNILFNFECIFSRFADLIIVNSHAGKKHYSKQKFATEKMLVIPNGIDIQRFQPHEKACLIRLEWGVSQDTVLIGLVGRLHPMKDYPTFFQAAKILCKNENIRFVCVGNGFKDYTEKLHQLTEDLGISQKVIWAGGRADMCAVFNALDIVVSASAYGEGFPNVIGEAMACGIPCVVTDVGDSAWIVGDLGIVVEPQNPEALAAGCSSLMKLNLADKIALKDKARLKIVQNFSVEKLVEKTQFHLLNLKATDFSVNFIASECD
jgi:glycosyltransferase involved in cell wall biosynthesis